MAFAYQAGTIAVEKIDNEVLPHAAKLATDILEQAAVLLTGSITALDGERQEAIGQAKKDLVDPILAELKAWRELLINGFEGKINGNIPFEIKAKS